ncbi:hypothetical protein [Bifidobacterium eulemuris]|uniref:Uncharacterized protein n=1 Tax=Bifidobacterium eulemuris TaxID=1765219 RepID=A0A261GA33_9BIFI|nr:hypothetical protein [Bifidobacterium eulemuris]OZG68279.1 hypothetical protein BEUL_1292 [Bifidobacterium eulemuris]QOL31667.1 hypothetical protein BE0216_03715 [Bifidobacterium eulemuris]
MVAKNTAKSTENIENVEAVETEASNTFPETWNELKGNPLFEGVPDMVQAADFSPTVSARFAVMRAHVQERADLLDKMGALGGDHTDSYDATAEVIAVAETIEYANYFYESIAVSEEAYHTWVKGRTAVDMFYLMLLLTRFYERALGKSSASKVRFETAE